MKSLHELRYRPSGSLFLELCPLASELPFTARIELLQFEVIASELHSPASTACWGQAILHRIAEDRGWIASHPAPLID